MYRVIAAGPRNSFPYEGSPKGAKRAATKVFGSRGAVLMILNDKGRPIAAKSPQQANWKKL